TYATIGIWAPILLIILRMLQGAAIGGEVPGAWTFVAEHVPANRVGMACGFLCSGLSLGILLGSFTAAGINWLFSPEQVSAFAWRIPFFLGGVFGLIGVRLRRHLNETPIFIEMKNNPRLQEKLPIKVVLKDHMHGVVIASLLTWILSAGIVVTTLMTATFLERNYGYSALEALLATSFCTLFLLVGTTVGGAMVDRFGSGKFFIYAGLIFCATTFTFYTYAGVSLSMLFFLYAVMGSSVGMVGAVPYVMVRAFPPNIRLSEPSLSYNITYANFGSLPPIAITSLMVINEIAPPWYLLYIGALTTSLTFYLVHNGHKIEGKIGLES